MSADSWLTRDERAVRGQILARQTNDKIADLSDGSTVDEYVCECGGNWCTGPVNVARREYEEIRAQPRQLLVLPGHWSPGCERVVRENSRFQVIEKIGTTARILERTGILHHVLSA